MKRVLSVLLSVMMLIFMVGCGAREKSATYELVTVEEGMFTMTDVQTINAKGDVVYELLETTTLEFAEMDSATLEMMLSYYDEVFSVMKESAPEGVEVASSYEDGVYTLQMNLYLENAELKELMDGGYLVGLDAESEEMEAVSFKKTAEGLEAAGYTLKE